MPGRRAERVAEQIREEVSRIILRQMHDPRIGFVTVTEARISDDLSHARIFVSVLGSDQEVTAALAALNSASGFIRHRLGAVLRLKRIPELHFVFDDTVRAAARIEELLSQVSSRAPEPDDQE